MADFDFFVIGGGSGGVRAARIASGHGAKVALAEDLYLGGTCVNVGCVPKKLLSYAAHFSHDFEDARGFGWSVGENSHDWSALIAAKDKEIQRLNGIYRKLLENSGVTIIEGHAKLENASTVSVNGKSLTAGKILIAVGGWPVVPDIPGAELGFTSNEAFHLKARPERIVVYGGGYIAVEFASIFRGLGSEVDLVYRGELFLRGFDLDIRKALAAEFEKQGIRLHFNTRIEKIEKGVTVFATGGKKINTDAVMYAIGRKPRIKNLGLENADIRTDDFGAIVVNEDDETNVPGIYAVGDVTNRINLTPVALAEGHALADRLFGGRQRHMSHENVASAVFSNPTIATVGLSEEQAQNRFGNNITVFQTSFRPMKHTLTGRDEKTLMKLIVDSTTDKVVGCHMLGADAPEIIQGISIAINAGATKADFDRTIGIHPTAAEEFVTLRTPRKA